MAFVPGPMLAGLEGILGILALSNLPPSVCESYWIPAGMSELGAGRQVRKLWMDGRKGMDPRQFLEQLRAKARRLERG